MFWFVILLLPNSSLWSQEEVTPAQLVRSGFLATHLSVGGTVSLTLKDGKREDIDVTFPVWARANSLAIPKSSIPDLVSLSERLEDHARKCRELAEEARAIKRDWIAFFSALSANQWHQPRADAAQN